MTKGPIGGVEIYKKRRQSLLKTINGVAILAAHPEQIRNDDVHHPYRQDSSFFYLSGFPEPESVLVLDSSKSPHFTLFVRERDKTRELWDGFRYGTDGTAEYFAPDKVYPIGELEKVLPEILKGCETVYYRLGENEEFDKTIMAAAKKAVRSKGRSGLGLHTFVDVKTLVGELRLFKSKEELAWLRNACEITAKGHMSGMRFTRPGVFEYEVQAEIEKTFRALGAERLGYGSIVGSGANATVLHYVFNNDKCQKDDLLLVDAGGEYNFLTADITRAYPVSGKFSATQRRFYEAVLKVQKECIQMTKPGVTIVDIHNRAVDGLVEQMLEIGLLKGDKKTISDKQTYSKYYPHRTSHWLGMDVHDCGLYTMNDEPRKLEPGMCFTIEPGLYVPVDDGSEFRGMGVRIEDDILVTAGGCEVLTKLAPKEVDEIEAIVGKSE